MKFTCTQNPGYQGLYSIVALYKQYRCCFSVLCLSHSERGNEFLKKWP